ncbi:hypothetical protein EMCG_04728 [[Emmonsia] crescens]|uniref:Uncharacterized protein n=1 Tax=[Emmonsia] crescens TaxID=73230 RepID=A0A0G2HRH0_9EURO|nr:hypothetical protein EMCG_04728 [Emmonsia crescens UAMH 3008]
MASSTYNTASPQFSNSLPNIASSTYDTASLQFSGSDEIGWDKWMSIDLSADGVSLPQLDIASFFDNSMLEACAPHPQSSEEPPHYHQMFPFSASSVSGDHTGEEACEIFTNHSTPPSAVSGFNDITWDEWMSFDPIIDVLPPSLHMSDFSDESTEESDPSPCDVAYCNPQAQLHRSEQTASLASDCREGNTAEDTLDSSDDLIGEASIDPPPCEASPIPVHRLEQIPPLASDPRKGDMLKELLEKEYIVLPLSQVTITRLLDRGNGNEMYRVVGRMSLQEPQKYGTHLQCLGTTEDPIIIDESTSPAVLSCDSDRFVAIPSLQRDIKKISGGYEVHANMTLDDMQDYGGLELLAAFWKGR